MGQIDIYPTLLDAMGLNDYSWRGMGHSILQYPVSSAVHWDKKSIYGNSDSPLIPDQIKSLGHIKPYFIQRLFRIFCLSSEIKKFKIF